jgi:type II secretion system protein L
MMATRSPSPRFATLRLTLPARTGWSELAWSAFDAAGEFVACGRATPDDLPTHGELDVVVPAGRIAAHQLHLPPREKKHLDALVGQAMDDRLLGDKADAVSVVAAPSGSGRTVWVCSRRWLAGELGRLASAGLRVDRVFPEYELLPPDAVATVCVETSDGTLFRDAERGFGLLDTSPSVALLAGQQAVDRLTD